MNDLTSGSHPRKRGAGGDTTPELYTLGGVRLERTGTEETSKLGPKHLALLIFLYQEDRPMHPSEVIELLGRGQSEEKEVEALKRAVSWLRDNVPGIDIGLTADTIEAQGGLRVDTKEVDAAIDVGDPEAARRLYRGEFLDGFESGSTAFDEWAQRERGRLKRAWGNVMRAAAESAESRGEWEVAAGWWGVLAERAPMRAEIVAGLLRSFARCGRRDDAARTYADYRRRLKESGMAEPAAAVKRVIAQHAELAGIEDFTTSDAAGMEEAAAQSPVGPTPPKTEPDRETRAQPSEQVPAEPSTPPAEPPPSADLPVEPAEATPPRSQTPPQVSKPAEPRPATEPAVEVQPPESPSAPDGEAETEESEEGTSADWADSIGLTETGSPAAEGPGPASTREAEASEHDAQPVAAKGAGAPRSQPAEARRPKRTSAAPRSGSEGRTSARRTAAAFVDTAFRAGSRRGARLRRKGAAGRGLRRVAAGLLAAFATLAKLLLAVPRWLLRPLWVVVGGRGLRAGARRFWYVPVGLILVAAAWLLGPRLMSWAGVTGFTSPAPDVQTAIPNVSLPSVSVPKVSLRTPSFVETSVSRIGALLSGPILDESGQWLVVADVAVVEYRGSSRPVETTLLPDSDAVRAGLDQLRRDSSPASPGSDDISSPPPGAPDSTTAPREPGDPTAGGAEDVGGVRGDTAFTAGSSTDEEDPLPLPPAPEPVELELPEYDDESPSPLASRQRTLTGAHDSARAPGLPDLDPLQIQGERGAVVGLQDSAQGVDDAEASADETAREVLPGPNLEHVISSAVLTLALETDLRQSRYFHVMPRERALQARRTQTGRWQEELTLKDALAVAAAEGYPAVVAARVVRYSGVDSVEMRLLSAAGDTLYGVAAQVSAGTRPLETLAGLTRAIRRRLGEPGDEVENSLVSSQILSMSPAALVAYAHSLRHFYARRYHQAVLAAREAVRRDSTFAMAYRAQAQAYALLSDRARARVALESAWQLSGRVTRRERLRLVADRHAWDGRHQDAILAYDQLFGEYRDDVAALRSQATMQRLVGARGGGEGNLKVAYTIDPYDWPPLSRIARYLGYAGPLPDVDSIIARLEISD